MSQPVSFPSTSARHHLPLLFAGQAQKEFFVNEALSRIDALLHPAIIEERSDTPTSPQASDMYLVGPVAAGDWAGREASLAAWQGSHWLFVEPTHGMMVRDLSTDQILRFDGDWQRVGAPAPPAGGTTIDSEARQAIDEIVNALRNFGIFPG